MPSVPTKLSVIFSGEVFDGANAEHPLIRDVDGATFVVRVRAMPARHHGRILLLCTEEAALLEFVCQVALRDDSTGAVIDWIPAAPEWVDNLDDASHALLYEAAERQNFSRAAKWGERQIAAKKFVTPLLTQADEILSPLVERMAHLLISSMRASASPDAPTTKS